jgi:hypothetical protein
MATTTLKSSNGWPASKDPAVIGVKSYPIPNTGIKIRVAEKVAPLLVALCADFHKLVEPIDVGTLDSWGYAFRPIRGQTEMLSNHSSGTAVDLNAEAHPLGKRETFTMEQETIVRQIAAKYGCRWGGDYKNRADEMHFEINLTPKQVKERITALGLDKEK